MNKHMVIALLLGNASLQATNFDCIDAEYESVNKKK